MTTMKHYFSYRMITKCGIPSIELRGSRDDWVSLRQRSEALRSFMTKDFAKVWLSVLLPILDEFIKSYDGKVNYGSWQTMVKFRETRRGSGAHEYISGWIQNFFPYLDEDSPSWHLRPWQEAYFAGPTPDQIPPIKCSVPVEWIYYGIKYPLHFHGGFEGF